MVVRYGSQASTVIQNALPAGAGTVVIFITPPLVVATDNAIVEIGWFASILTSSTGNALSFTIYRGTSDTGVQVSFFSWEYNVGASANGVFGGTYYDQPGGGAFQYALTVFQGGASTAGTLSDGCLVAFVL